MFSGTMDTRPAGCANQLQNQAWAAWVGVGLAGRHLEAVLKPEVASCTCTAVMARVQCSRLEQWRMCTQVLPGWGCG